MRTAPRVTPEHNRLRALFLNDEYDAAMLSLIFGNTSAPAKRKLKQEWRRRNTNLEMKDEDFLFDRYVSCEFEEGGWPVVITGDLVIAGRGGAYGMSYASVAVYVELEPRLGDDFTPVLRRLKAKHRTQKRERGYRVQRVLLIDHFTAQGITFDQVGEIFHRYGVEIVQLSQLEGVRRGSVPVSNLWPEGVQP